MTESLPAPRLADAYEILEVVRRGGLSTTFRARHRGTGDLRCIDVLRPAPGEPEALERRLDADVRPLMELRHDHVARFVDAAVGEEGRACLVREDHEGVTLRRFTGTSRPSVSLAVELLRQAAGAMAFLHSRDRTVGDLAPEGMLVGRRRNGEPQLIVADLGLAKDWQEEAALTAAGLFLGRLRYTAPELFEAAGRWSAPGDVYVLGLTAYEILTGRYPITGDTASSLIAGHLFRPPMAFADSDPEERVPTPLRRLVLSALSKDPEQRPSSDVFESELAGIQETLPAFEVTELDRWIDPARGHTKHGESPSSVAIGEPAQSPTVDVRGPSAAGSDSAAPSTRSISAMEVDESRLESWLGEARALARDEEFLAARDKVRQVLKVRPDHSMGLMLLASLEACLKIQVEESKSHQTQAVGSDLESGVSDSESQLQAGAQTVMLSSLGADDVRDASGTETVQVTFEQLRGLGSPASSDDAMATQHMEPLSQVPGGPASTERLDLDQVDSRLSADLDNEKTRPLTPELLNRFRDGDAEKSDPKPGPSFADEATQLLAEGLPATATMPMAQIEEQKRRSFEGSVGEGHRPAGSRDTAAEESTPSRSHDASPSGGEPTESVLPPSSDAVRSVSSAEVHETAEAVPEGQDTYDSDSATAATDSSSDSVSAPVSPPEESASDEPEPVPAPTPAPVRPEAAASVDEMGFGGAPSPPFVERSPRARRGRRRGRNRPRRQGRSSGRSGGKLVLVGASVIAVLVFAIGYSIAAGIDLGRLVGLGGSPDPVPQVDSPPAAAEPGWLLLDATPWGEIVRISDSLGEEVPLRFRHTPARYSLAPGPYTIIMASPDGDQQTLQVEVMSQQTAELRAGFSELSVEDYFRLMGWR
ncbi:MAG: serine/threonine protein kinase [Thermoanaerobaculia bacterium]|nr:serine/threonine protein kinase [Thermoanaerobaculia bacterium]